MPELSVTEEQLERLETVRSELEAAFLDGYGHMRRHDAVEYLLDTYTPPTERRGTDATGETGDAATGSADDVTAGETDGAATDETADAGDNEERVRAALDREVRDEEGGIDYPTLQSVARNTEGVKGSGTSAEEMYEALVEAKVRELEAGETDEVDFVVDGPEQGDADADAEEIDEADEIDDTEDTDDDTGAVDGDDTDESGASGSEAREEGSDGATAASGGGGSQLQAMMNLLETHDDKWRKATSGDAPYEVDLPDGGTESARTKDDVKRVLFTNY